VSRETRFGLLIGLVFICLFGVILSGRANSSVQEHAAMPTGNSGEHATKFKAINSNVELFGKTGTPDGAAPDSALVAGAKEMAAPPAEEALPAPERLSPAESLTPKSPERGMVAFMPVKVETPTGAEQPDRVARLELPPEHEAGTPAAPAPEAGRRVYVVKAGDTLVKVSRQFFGKDGDRLTTKIYEANKATLKDPNRLVIGTKLIIPGVPAEAPKADAPKADTPRGDPPKKGLPLEPVSDAVFAKADKAGQPPLVIPTSYRKDVPAAPGAAKLPPAGVVRDISVQDLGRMYGTASDLAEQPTKPPAMYTVQAGDTFNKIAEKKYGDGNKYGRLLFLKNQHLVSDPSKLKIGQRIVLLDGVSASSDTAVALR